MIMTSTLNRTATFIYLQIHYDEFSIFLFTATIIVSTCFLINTPDNDENFHFDYVFSNNNWYFQTLLYIILQFNNEFIDFDKNCKK